MTMRVVKRAYSLGRTQEEGGADGGNTEKKGVRRSAGGSHSLDGRGLPKKTSRKKVPKKQKWSPPAGSEPEPLVSVPSNPPKEKSEKKEKKGRDGTRRFLLEYRGLNTTDAWCLPRMG